jgi:murein L,D-transpeptidase YcbB/YkuD
MPLSCESFSSRLFFLGGLLLLSLFYAPKATYAEDSPPFTSPSVVNGAALQSAPVNPESGAPTGNNGGTSSSTAPTGDQGQMLLQQRLEQLYFEIEDSVGKEPVYTSGYLLDLYRKNQFNPLWDNQDNISQLMGAIAAVADEGLIPDDYHLQALTRYANELKENASPAKLVEYDLLLSDALVLLGQHKRYGKVDPRKVEEKKNLEATTPRPSPIDTYLTAIKTGTVRATLDKLSPHHPSYVNLKDALSQYKQFAGKSGWQQVPLGQSIKPGMSDQRVPAIRHRLAITGEYRPRGGSSASNLYDDHLVAAVKAFQARHHLEPDGAAGKTTINAMNVTVAERINQIRVNLERTRWVIHDMPSSSLVVDIAGFMLQYYHENKMVWSGKVMVGKPFHQTPIFRSAITYIVLNPTWTPTPDIVKNETVPSIVKDPEFLTKQRLRIFDSSGTEIDPNSIPWKQYQGKFLPYTLRQDSGKDNSLGLIKFLFPNPYHVYLHDTPSKSLFGRTQRAFSHGCIRVQNPLELGRLILANDVGNLTTVERMDRLLALGKTSTVILKQSLPIYLMYLTTNVLDGKVMFKPDLYSRDEGVLAALNAPPSRLELTTQVPEAKAQPTNQQVKIDKAIKYVQTEKQNPPEPYAKDTL